MRSLERRRLIAFLSRPLRGAWIEACLVRTSKSTYAPHVTKIYSPLCMQILNILHIAFHVRSLHFGHICCRTPQGVRGLKSVDAWDFFDGRASHPARGAWIEVCHVARSPVNASSHPVRGAWIEVSDTSPRTLRIIVAPRRGAWIEVTTTWRAGWRSMSHPAGVRGLKRL